MTIKEKVKVLFFLDAAYNYNLLSLTGWFVSNKFIHHVNESILKTLRFVSLAW